VSKPAKQETFAAMRGSVSPRHCLCCFADACRRERTRYLLFE